MTEGQRCGKCFYFGKNSYGYKHFCKAPLPKLTVILADSMKLEKRMMGPTEGTDCKLFKPKETP